MGKSVAVEAREAAREAVAEASRGVKHGSLALAFSTTHYEPEPLARALASELGDLPWIGCCSAGVVAGPDLLRRGLVVGLLDAGADAQVGVGVAGPTALHPRRSGRMAVRRALEGLPMLAPGHSRLLITLLESEERTTEVIRGAAQEAGSDPLWTGGGAGDNFGYTRAVEYACGRAYSDHVAVAVLDVPGPVGLGLDHGWQPRGPAAMVTRSAGSKVLEFDYAGAFDIYGEIAALHGESVDAARFTAFAMMHPLGIPVATGSHLIRDPIQVDAHGGLDCVAEVPEGSLVRMMTGQTEGLLEASQHAARQAREALGGRPPAGALLFDCYSRMLSLGSHFPEELRGVQAALGAEVPVIGCLTLGEVGAINGGVPQFHNKTAVVTAF